MKSIFAIVTCAVLLAVTSGCCCKKEKKCEPSCKTSAAPAITTVTNS